MKNLGEYGYKLLIHNYIYSAYKKVKCAVVQSLFNKKVSFFKKVDKNNLFLLNEAIYQISEFNVCEYSSLLSNILVGIICIGIASAYSPQLLIIVLAVVVIEIFFTLIKTKKATE